MQPTTSAQALQNLSSFQSSMQKPEDILTSQEQSLGVPQATSQVQGLRGAIQNTTNLLGQVAPSVYGRTQNSLETNAQASRNIQNEQAPISETLGKQNTDYGNQESDLQNLLSKAGTLASLKAQGQSGTEGYLENIYKDLYGQEQDSQAEADKQAALKASSSSSSSSSGGGSSKVSAADQLSQSVSSMYSELRGVVGSDGFISPQDYSKGMAAWTAAGLSPSQYDTYFAQFRNPNNPHYRLSNGKYV